MILIKIVEKWQSHTYIHAQCIRNERFAEIEIQPNNILKPCFFKAMKFVVNLAESAINIYIPIPKAIC